MLNFTQTIFNTFFSSIISISCGILSFLSWDTYYIRLGSKMVEYAISNIETKKKLRSEEGLDK